MGQITKVTPDMIQVANNVTSKTVGNTTSGISLTFDSNGVITSAANVTLSVANTQLTGTINSAQIASNTISNTNIATGAVENYLRANALDFGMRNRIINGAMVIDQRNAGANVVITNTSDVTYTLDRWVSYGIVASKFSIQRDSSANTVAGFTSSLKVTSTSAYSPNSTDFFFLGQYIEGFNTADLDFGKSTAKTITLSFWTRSSLTGTFGGSIQNSNTNRSYPFSYTISSANTWEYKTITIPGDTSGTWIGATNELGMRLWFNLGTGSTYSATAGAWAAGDYRNATGTVSLVSTNGATLYITGVQLEEGSTATSYEYRSYGAELALCYRYYWKQDESGNSNTPFATLAAWTSSDIRGYLQFPVPMRSNPTWSVGTVGNIACQSNGTGYTASGYTLLGSSLNAGFIKFSVSGAPSPAAFACFANPNPVNSAFSAEL